MVVLIALGVARAGQLTVPQIPAAQDAEQFYRVTAQAVGLPFDHTRSICLIDPTVAEARLVVNRTAALLTGRDTLIVFYSGHGSIRQSRLFLNFVDAQENGCGQVSVAELGEWLVASESNRVIILDCCRSGAALGLANREDIYQAARTAVIASAEAHLSSTFTKAGSDFTNALCNAIQRLQSERSPLSLTRLVQLIRDGHVERCTINLPEGQHDSVIPASYDVPSLPNSFPKNFLARIHESPIVERQHLWFDLTKVPLGLRFATIERYLRSTGPSEPSWLVRRALGTALGTCEVLQDAWRSLCLELIGSADWMRCAIGLIASRQHLDEATLREAARGVFGRVTEMDTVWLAHLYLSDSAADALPQVLGSALRESAWGIIEIFTRWALDEAVIDKALSNVPQTTLRTVATHFRLAETTSASLARLAYDADVVASPLARFLYARRRRGRTVDPELKSLLSTVYGNWRDQLQGDVREWLENQETQKVDPQLTLCDRLPAVETRMAVFADLSNDQNLMQSYRTSLQWGLEDAHPWVRREAAQAFRHNADVAAAAIVRVANMSVYPGVVDLYLEGARQGLDVQTEIAKRGFSPRVSEALTWALPLETKHQ